MEESYFHTLSQCAREKALDDVAEKKRKKVVRHIKPIIPHDIMFEILTRLPVKSLLRFKCVSTLWFSTITSRDFINAHSLQLRACPELVACDYECHSLFPPTLLVLSAKYQESVSNQCKEMICTFTHDFTINVEMTDSSRDPQSVRGLICYDFGCHLRISNPGTKKIISIDYPPESILSVTYKKVLSFGYDPIDSEYKILYSRNITGNTEYFVYPLSEKKWRSINAACPNHIQRGNSICIKGTVYYKAETYVETTTYVQITTYVYTGCLMAFEVRSETFHMIPYPPYLKRRERVELVSLALVEFEGCPALIKLDRFASNDGFDLNVHIMILEDPGNGASPSWRHKGFKIHWSLASYKVSFRGVYGDELLFTPCRTGAEATYLDCYNVKTFKVRRIEIRGLPSKTLPHSRFFGPNCCCSPCSDIVFTSYVETLEPLP